MKLMPLGTHLMVADVLTEGLPNGYFGWKGLKKFAVICWIFRG